MNKGLKIQDKLKAFFFTDKGLYPLILICLLGFIFATISLQKGVKELKEIQANVDLLNGVSPIQQLKSEATSPQDLGANLERYYCGIYKSLLLTFEFQKNGGVSTWIRHVSDEPMTFPPKTKPQQISKFFIKEGYLHWSFNIHGIAESFKVPLLNHIRGGLKQFFFKEGDSFFSSSNCYSFNSLKK